MTASGRRTVTVYAKSTSVAASPVRPGKTYPLSVLDHAMTRHTLRLVFYYRPGPTMDRDRLKESLSDVLTHYPAMTGRLMRGEEGGGGWVVKCNDAGVRVLDAQVGITLDEWLCSATAMEEMELAYWEPMGSDPSIWSPYYVQISEFADKGFAIGLSCTHMHVDPACAILFIKAWGDAHRRTSIAHPPFFHPPALQGRPTPNTTTSSVALLAAKSSASPIAAAKMSSATFRFSDQAVHSCLADILPTCPEATPFDALAALFWSRIAHASATKVNALTLCVDFRKFMHAPLPHGFYGNAQHFSSVKVDLDEGLGHVASSLRAHVAGTEEEEYWSAVDWLESQRPGFPEGQMPQGFPMYGPELTCVRLDHVFAYGAVFENGDGGKPAHVTCRVGPMEGEGLVLVMPSPEEGDGRTVAVTLPEEVMDRITRDEVIMKLEPTVLLSGRV